MSQAAASWIKKLTNSLYLKPSQLTYEQLSGTAPSQNSTTRKANASAGKNAKGGSRQRKQRRTLKRQSKRK